VGPAAENYLPIIACQYQNACTILLAGLVFFRNSYRFSTSLQSPCSSLHGHFVFVALAAIEAPSRNYVLHPLPLFQILTFSPLVFLVVSPLCLSSGGPLPFISPPHYLQIRLAGSATFRPSVSSIPSTLSPCHRGLNVQSCVIWSFSCIRAMHPIDNFFQCCYQPFDETPP